MYTSLVALAQEDMKKLIAYSSIAHMGFVTLGFFAIYQIGSDNADFQALMDKLNKTTDPDMRVSLMGDAQKIIADDAVNGYLFQLAALTVAKADVQGLWANAPTAATDLTVVSWK